MSQIINLARFDALFFDLDGTLVDSRSDFQAALAQVLHGYKRPLSTEEYAYTIGHSWEDIYQTLQKRIPLPISLSQLEEETYQMRLHRIKHQGPATLPGAKEAVIQLSQKVPCALVTGSSRKEAQMLVESLGLAACFRFLVCSGEAKRGKPAPDPYLLAAYQLGVNASRSAVLEDSTVGISSAKAAGMFCIAIRAGNFSNQDQSAADYVVDTMTHFEAWLTEKSTSSQTSEIISSSSRSIF